MKKTLSKLKKDIKQLWRMVKLEKKTTETIEPSGKVDYGGNFSKLKYKCPVCREEFLESGLRNHMKQSAYREVYEWYNNKVSRTPHQNYLEDKEIELGGQ